MSLPRRRRLVEVARERELLVLEDNPYGLLRYEGEPLPTLYSLDARGGRARRRLGPRDLPGHVLEDPLARAAAGLGGGAAAGAGEAEPRQTGRRPVLLADDAAVRRGLLRGAGAGDLGRRGSSTWSAEATLPAPARRDAGGARGALRRQGAAGRARRAGCSSGRRSTAASTRPTCCAAQRGRRVRAGPRRLHGRAQRLLLDALELRRACPTRTSARESAGSARSMGGQAGLLGRSPDRAAASAERRRRQLPAAPARAPAGRRRRSCRAPRRRPARRRRSMHAGRRRSLQRRRSRASASRCSRAAARWSATCRCARARRCRRR